MKALKLGRAATLAVLDIREGATRWPLWVALGWNDIRQRYRRSILGPFWLTASMGVMVLALGIIYARIFHVEVSNYIPFLCVGLLIWSFVSSIFNEIGTLFVGSESFIKQIKLPFSVYVYRFVWSRLIVFGHNFVTYLGVITYFRINPGATVLLALIGLAFLVINALLVSLYLGMLAARFRDIPPIVASCVQIVFFITPLMWKPDVLGETSLLVVLNPFYHLVELARSPLLGQLPTFANLSAVGLLTLFNVAIASAFFVNYRSRITYWV